MDNIVRGIVGAGKSTPGEGWQPHNEGIYIDVDTSSANFRSDLDTPVYLISLSGTGGTRRMWNALGASTVHEPTERGFRVYLKHVRDASLPPSQAQEAGWYVNWIGLQKVS
ncbi:hypothetical protein ABT382_37320 [Streptomyces pharetrae]|uniref:hypothetical protein n=1 Tax=Streptomyces pharetrae TaxID=291370 RepID=UPI003357A677